MTRWYVKRDSEGLPLIVVRIREQDGGYVAERWKAGDWEFWPPGVSYWVDPLAADEVDEARAEAAVRRLAGGDA
jgi:hypothetical protein